MCHSKQLFNNHYSMFFEDEAQESDYRIFELDTVLKRKIWRT
jgi:hypothetical protein